MVLAGRRTPLEGKGASIVMFYVAYLCKFCFCWCVSILQSLDETPGALVRIAGSDQICAFILLKLLAVNISQRCVLPFKVCR